VKYSQGKLANARLRGHFSLVPLNICGYAILDVVVPTFGTLRAVVGVLYFFAKRV
jgi:hypothetical protein